MVIEQFEPSKYNQMNKTKNLPDLQDFTFKASLYPKQVFIGNYELKLKENTTLDFYYNNRNRLSIKFSIEADPKCGYSQRDLGIAITQFEQISTRKAMNQYPAAIVANPFQKAAQNIVNVFGDLKNRLEQQVPAEIKSIEYMKRQLIFTLREDPEDKTEEIFMNISSNKEGNHKTWSFDMDEMIEIFHTDIKERWNACLSEQWSRRAEKITKNRYGNNVESMSEGDWKGYMKSLSLHYKILNSGDYRYLLFKENPNLKSHIIQYTNAPKRRAESSLSETEADRNQSMDQNKNREIKKPRLEEGKEASPSIAVPENYNNKPSGLEKSEREPNRIDVTPNTQLFVFPEKKMEKLGGESVVVCVKDVHTLGRCEFLNDTMIAFKFAHVLCYEIDEKLREKVHFFNTFFYSALVRDLNSSVFSGKRTKNGIVVEDLTLVNLAKDKKNMDKFELTDRERATVYQIEKSYRQLLTNAERLTKWTKKFDLFLKDYVVIPINEDFHWVLIIIVNPSGAIVEKNNEEESRTKPKTYIVFFDPLRGLDPSKKNHMCFCVREYLMKLFAKTKQVGATFGTKTESYYDESRISFVIPKNLPIQKNFSDCGLYVLHYIEGFFCGFKPITVDNFPNFDWADFYEEGHAMADLMRDKMYRLVTSKCDRMARSRLAKHEEMIKHGLGLETNKRTRRHSAGAWPRTSKRNSAYFFRHLSLNPPARNVSEDPFFSNPRELYVNPTAIKIRKLALPCERFPALY